jgi:hypothetical protein
LSILAADAGVGAVLSNHQLGGLHGVVAEALVDVYHRTDEVHADLIGGTNTKDVSPELLTFLDGPLRSTLVNRDDELGDGAQDLEELGFCGFHMYLNSLANFYSGSRTKGEGLWLV